MVSQEPPTKRGAWTAKRGFLMLGVRMPLGLEVGISTFFFCFSPLVFYRDSITTGFVFIFFFPRRLKQMEVKDPK